MKTNDFDYVFLLLGAILLQFIVMFNDMLI